MYCFIAYFVKCIFAREKRPVCALVLFCFFVLGFLGGGAG